MVSKPGVLRWFAPLSNAAARSKLTSHTFSPRDFEPALKARLLILQPTPFCNINCDYCYLRNRDSRERMPLEVVRAAAQRLAEDDLIGEELTVVWHAGEPLAVPKGFYTSAFAAIEDSLPDCRVSHSIQTNATLVDDEWCELFKHYNVRIGVSVDGPAALHDRHRLTRDGKGTHAKVVKGMRLLRKHGIPFHAIAVVTASTLAEPDSFADFFSAEEVQEVGCNFDEAEGLHAASSLAGQEALHNGFLQQLLARSMASAGQLRIRELVSAFRLISERPSTYRWRGQTLPHNEQVIPFALISVACNGDFSTFSPELLGQVNPRFKDFVLGNVMTSAYLTSARTQPFIEMWNEILQGIGLCRSKCKYFDYCGGGARPPTSSTRTELSPVPRRCIAGPC